SGCRMDVGGRSADVGNDEIPPALAIGRTLAQELAGPQNGAWRRNDLRYEPDLLCGALDALGPRDMTHEQLTDCRVHLLDFDAIDLRQDIGRLQCRLARAAQ